MTSSATVSKWLFIIPNHQRQYLPGSIVRRRNEAHILSAVSNRLEGVGDLIKALEDVTEEIDGGVQLHLGVISLHSGRANGNVDAVSTDSVVVRDDRHVDI